MKVGIDTRIFKSRPLDEALKIISRLFSIVEICASHIRGESSRRGITLRELARNVRLLCKDLGVEVAQIHAPYGELDEMLANPEARDRGLEVVLSYVELCSAVECPVLVMHVPLRKLRLDESYVDYTEHLRESTRYVIRRLDRELSKYGVKIAFENRLEQVFGSSPRDVVLLIEEEGAENFGLCLDTGHANVNKLDPALVVEKYGRYIIATHIHDNDGTQDRHAPPLTGSISWRRFIQAVQKYCPHVPLILEVEAPESCAENVLELCKLVMDYLLRG